MICIGNLQLPYCDVVYFVSDEYCIANIDRSPELLSRIDKVKFMHSQSLTWENMLPCCESIRYILLGPRFVTVFPTYGHTIFNDDIGKLDIIIFIG